VRTIAQDALFLSLGEPVAQHPARDFGPDAIFEKRFEAMNGKAMIVCMSRRICVALYDAIVASAAHMKQDASLQKRVLLVVTDGEDNASQDSLEEAVQQLQEKDGPVVYVIALLNPARRMNSTIQSLQAISQNTGGAAYFPTDVQQVESITRKIASAIRSQYVIGYKSSSTAVGHSYHAIEVDACRGQDRVFR